MVHTIISNSQIQPQKLDPQWVDWSGVAATEHTYVLLFNGSQNFTLPLPLISAYKDKQHQSLSTMQKFNQYYCIAQNFRGRKHSWTLQFWSHPRKFSPWNLGVPYPPMIGFSIPQKFYLRNGSSYWSAKIFSLENFLLYGGWFKQLAYF